ncbi:putative methionyl-tRNA synthetase [Selenomonas ruminantium subsp. lactilytica TAM6421]|uniref:Methionine--tRNA ligase n=1 Tax=Selenomonas ruminantium subsp. lactilytica (strain NBRC 103574 / TAM6421) TaxID=927704 RepID=I0GMB2_SELRL|nr:methionine--tRNA ligase [Selenomonas ruminantium]BAL81899.1 putative methionyl-tRNA synthetase [Selenomonas ruminantium subsp. lactilytica TAM6421]
MSEKKPFYITTPIYYPSAKLHIGHAYCTTIADSIARFHRLAGDDVFFLTGSDEHGQKIQQKAEEAGIKPIEYTDKIVAGFQNLWQKLNISNDDFIRTTEKRHEKVVQEIFRRIYAKGDIYKGEYKGLYCTPCESYWTEHQLDENGCCPDCGRPVQEVSEEAYFFKMSNYQDRILNYIEEHPDFIQPVSRRNEMINFIKQGLEDLCISRTSFDWGIPVPMDEKHVIYVWFDALTNYLTPIGFLDDPEKFNKYWPANLHLVGKEIVRFHTIIWPCILMALDLPLPEKVYGHGWLIVDGDKMSKSKGNVIDPIGLIDEFGADAIRYFLLREINLGQDGNFSRDALIQRINSDLANDLGNLLHRTLNMVGKFQDGVLIAPQGESDIDKSLKADAAETVSYFAENMEKMELSLSIKKVWAFISRANKYIDETAPWALAKDETKKQELANVMYNLAESLRQISVLISPFMPITAERIWQQLNLPGKFADVQLDDIKTWGGIAGGHKVGTPEQLFPRIEVEKEETPAKAAKPAKEKKNKQEKQEKAAEENAEVSIDDFAKIHLRVVKVLSAEPVPKTEKLLKLTVDLGDEQREIVSGIAKHYEPADLVGKNVVMVINLKPAKIRGIVSHGMVLAASNGDDLQVLSVDMPVGSTVR